MERTHVAVSPNCAATTAALSPASRALTISRSRSECRARFAARVSSPAHSDEQVRGTDRPTLYFV